MTITTKQLIEILNQMQIIRESVENLTTLQLQSMQTGRPLTHKQINEETTILISALQKQLAVLEQLE